MENLKGLMILFLSCSLGRADGSLHFECVNLNSLSNWFTELPEGKENLSVFPKKIITVIVTVTIIKQRNGPQSLFISLQIVITIIIVIIIVINALKLHLLFWLFVLPSILYNILGKKIEVDSVDHLEKDTVLVSFNSILSAF